MLGAPAVNAEQEFEGGAIDISVREIMRTDLRRINDLRSAAHGNLRRATTIRAKPAVSTHGFVRKRELTREAEAVQQLRPGGKRACH